MKLYQIYYAGLVDQIESDLDWTSALRDFYEKHREYFTEDRGAYFHVFELDESFKSTHIKTVNYVSLFWRKSA